MPENQRAVYIKRANDQKQEYERLLAQYKKTDEYKTYQRYLQEFFAERPNASGRKRTYSEVKLLVETTPLTSPNGSLETPKRQKVSNRRYSTATPGSSATPSFDPFPVTPRRGMDHLLLFSLFFFISWIFFFSFLKILKPVPLVAEGQFLPCMTSMILFPVLPPPQWLLPSRSKRFLCPLGRSVSFFLFLFLLHDHL